MSRSIKNPFLKKLLEKDEISLAEASAALAHEKQMNNEAAEDYLTRNKVASMEVMVKALGEVRDISYLDASALSVEMISFEWGEEHGGIINMVRKNFILPINHPRGVILVFITHRSRDLNTAMNIVQKLQYSESKKYVTAITDPEGAGEIIEVALLGNAELASQPRLQFDRQLNSVVEEKAEDKAEKIFSLIRNVAVRENASDIHIEPETDVYDIRLRIDGVLAKIASLSLSDGTDLCRHILAASKNDLDEYSPTYTRLSFAVKQGGKESFREMRIAAKQQRRLEVAGLSGAKGYLITMVIRLLNSSSVIPSLSNLGYSKKQAAWIDNIAFSTSGVTLIVGETGSGKSTTLASMLNMRRSPGEKICTAEDPVEYNIPRITQVEINRESFDFKDALVLFLRCDPDVIMLGEIRDEDTLNAALAAAISGHPVFSTLHARDSISTIDRIDQLAGSIDMRMVLDSLNAVISQRLVKMLCPECSTKGTFAEFKVANEQKLPRFGNLDSWFNDEDVLGFANNHANCVVCHGSGYFGRTTIVEILEFDDEFREFAGANRQIGKMKRFCFDRGHESMFHDAQRKLLDGDVDFVSVQKKLDPWPKDGFKTKVYSEERVEERALKAAAI